jgi:hypothetical protein
VPATANRRSTIERRLGSAVSPPSFRAVVAKVNSGDTPTPDVPELRRTPSLEQHGLTVLAAERWAIALRRRRVLEQLGQRDELALESTAIDEKLAQLRRPHRKRLTLSQRFRQWWHKIR